MRKNAKRKKSNGNLLVSLCVAVAAVIYFSYRSPGTPPPSTAKVQASAVKPSKSPNAQPEKSITSAVEEQTVRLQAPGAVPQQTRQAEILPPGMPADHVQVTQGAQEVTLPPDIQAQLDSKPPELPEDLKRQLNSPPPELPEDLKAQLNAPPPELPEDIKRALQTPPRIVSIDEVNNPEKLHKESAPPPAAQ
jgi:hypothetical protein